MSEPHSMTAMALAHAIKVREIGSRELTDHFIDRIEARDGPLNAVIARDFERARVRADQADAALAKGETWGSLHGVPITIKDAFEAEGLVTTCGDPRLKAHVPGRDADPVGRLRAAGAIILGKTNVPLLAGDFQSFNAIYGATNNPWNTDLTPGGSSGGAAASVAAGFTAFELGSDIGGSIRNPCHFCGAFGHKPSYGIVPQRGHIPPMPGALAQADLCVTGPIARGAGDLAPLLEIIAGPEAGRKGWKLDLPPPRHRSPKGLRVALWLDNPLGDTDKEVLNAIEAAAKSLERDGAIIDTAARPGFSFAEAFEVYALIMNAIIAADFPPKIRDRLLERAGTTTPGDLSHDALMARGAALTYAGWLDLNQRRAWLKAQWADFFRSYDVVLCPPAPVAAFPHDHRSMGERMLTINGEPRPYLDMLHWASLATGSDLPASVSPAGRSRTGLPLGVQIIGPLGEDMTPIAVAEMLESCHMGFEPPPGLA